MIHVLTKLDRADATPIPRFRYLGAKAGASGVEPKKPGTFLEAPGPVAE
jgi:hypothetical protein